MRGSARGIPFSNAPGMAYEYSNFGFAILGQVVAKASGKHYDDYVRKEILEPLQMSASTFEASEVPRDRVALDTVGRTTPGRVNRRSGMARSERWVAFGRRHMIWPATSAS